MSLPVREILLAVLLFSMSAQAAEPWQRHTIDNSSRGADGVRLADANHDGLPDIVTGWEEGGCVRVYLNPGATRAKQPWPAVTVGNVASPEDAILIDLDADGAVDVVSCCEGKTRSVFVHWAPTDPQQYLEASAWRTEAFPALERRQSWMYALPLQVDGRHGVDLVLGSKGKATVGWLQAPADPRDVTAWKWHPLYTAGWIMSLAAEDLDTDGDMDIVVSDRKGTDAGLLWLEHPGEQAARTGQPWKEHRIGADGLEVMFLAMGDIDGDSRSDIVLSTRNQKLLTFTRKELNWVTDEIANPFASPHGKAVAIGDLDGDQLPDLVHAINNGGNRKLPGVTWTSSRELPLTSAGRRTWHDISGAQGVKFDLLQLLDLDADGDLDVISCEERDNLGVFWYENPHR
jgi:hypothetical protein